MTHEAPLPGPEREMSTQYELFNLGAMTDEQIIMTGRAFISEYDRQADTSIASGQYVEPHVMNELTRKIDEDFGRLAGVDLRRAQSIIATLEASEEKYDMELVGDWVIRIAPHDFEFARNAILKLRVRDLDSATSAEVRLPDFVTADQMRDYEEREAAAESGL